MSRSGTYYRQLMHLLFCFCILGVNCHIRIDNRLYPLSHLPSICCFLCELWSLVSTLQIHSLLCLAKCLYFAAQNWGVADLSHIVNILFLRHLLLHLWYLLLLRYRRRLLLNLWTLLSWLTFPLPKFVVHHGVVVSKSFNFAHFHDGRIWNWSWSFLHLCGLSSYLCRSSPRLIGLYWGWSSF